MDATNNLRKTVFTEVRKELVSLFWKKLLPANEDGFEKDSDIGALLIDRITLEPLIRKNETR